MKLILFFFFFILTQISASSCPEGSVEFRGFCYLFQTIPTSFFNAELACNGLNGHLTSVHDGFTNGIITGQALNFFHERTDNDYWIGLNTLMVSGNWSWTDNSTFDFKDWAASQPQNLSMSCAAITSQTGLWKSDDCFKTKPYVCAVPVSTTTTSTTTTTRPAYMNCSAGWVYFEPTYSCYVTDAFTSWTNAENYCQSVGAHLVSLHSYEEQKFVSTLKEINGYAWTGLYSNDNEKTWKWSDGSSVDYLPWYSGYPNLNVSSCAMLFAKNIFDSNCAVDLFTLCKKSAPLSF